METLLIFLAIIAIQMIAAYSSKKKEAAKKKVLPPVKRHTETAQIPDPFREIREMMGMPPVEESEEYVPEKISRTVLQHATPPESEHKREGFAPGNLTFQSAVEKKQNEDNRPVCDSSSQVRIRAVDTNNLEQGILWTAILQEPRHKIKWKSSCSPSHLPLQTSP